MSNSGLRPAFSHLAWGYLLLFFHINLGSLPLLPAGAAYLILVRGITLLRDEDRDLYLLRPFGFALSVFALAQLLPAQQLTAQGAFSGGVSACLSLAQSIVYLYFHFSLLTACARIADRFQPNGGGQGRRLRTCRTLFIGLDTVLSTGLSLWLLPPVIITVLSAVLLFIALFTAVALFLVRSLFPTPPDAAPAE